MTSGLLGHVLYVAVVVGLAWPLAGFMQRVYAGERSFLTPALAPVERAAYRPIGFTHVSFPLSRSGERGVRRA